MSTPQVTRLFAFVQKPPIESFDQHAKITQKVQIDLKYKETFKKIAEQFSKYFPNNGLYICCVASGRAAYFSAQELPAFSSKIQKEATQFVRIYLRNGDSIQVVLPSTLHSMKENKESLEKAFNEIKFTGESFANISSDDAKTNDPGRQCTRSCGGMLKPEQKDTTEKEPITDDDSDVERYTAFIDAANT